MVVSTRSKAKQSHLEDFENVDSKTNPEPKGASGPKSMNKKLDTSRLKATDTLRPTTITEIKKDPQPRIRKRKRKLLEAQAQPQPSPPVKKQRQSRLTKPDKTTSKVVSPSASASAKPKPILINRSPVLQLWSACVAQKLHPDLSWPTSIAVGSAIATFCAISKGRAIGTIEPSSTTKEEKAERRRQDQVKSEREVTVMGFKILLPKEDGVVLALGKRKPGNEGALKAKFGDEENYARLKNTMEAAIEKWSGREDELGKKAFGMYEKFRPSVQSGQGGWGRKGELKLETIEEVVKGE
ncbi:uncharacterized protein Z518_10990 [Rhinocladiella mackenziei CBS 650.93]|uniref:Uncharacterized protein n=1 Tax=Rhinocladiella mackenziei CBS 650.93 TaxID=1442369 RepID=A0A0D2GP14_9EURO|nr:uncharacterized protein Z518_10990 [Rhinocladiella mackenziei CBS 650.93]KIX00063.1 hypothetical protein Z518_10990 [Rhinocladiella mackenziei CBS 650.93]